MRFTQPFRIFDSLPVAQAVQLCLLGVFIIVAYYPALHTPFVFDDIPNIVMNGSVHTPVFNEILNAFHSNVSGSRPLAMLTFAVNYWIGDLNVYSYHLFNLGVHIVNAVMLYFCIVAMCSIPGSHVGEDMDGRVLRNLAFWGAMLWALNPVQHQAVTYIVQRMTSLATLFYLLGILSYLKFRGNRLSGNLACILISLCFVAGMACKEIVITMPICLILMDRILIRPGQQLHVKWTAALICSVIVVSAVYIHGRLPDFFEKYPNRDFSPYERLLTEPRVLWHYLSLLILPLPDRLHLDYYYKISHSLISPFTTLLAIIATLAVLTSAWIQRRRWPLLSFAIIFFFLAASVEASFLNLEIAFIHRIYLPSLFVFPALLMCFPLRLNKYLGPAVIVIFSLFTYGTMQRNYEWQTTARLWQADYDRHASPDRSIINGSKGLMELGRYQEAIARLEPISDKFSGKDKFLALYILALSHFFMDDYTKAIADFERMDDYYKKVDQVLFYEGLAYLNLHRDKEVEVIEARLYELFPHRPYRSILIAEQERRNGSYKEAISVLEQAIHNMDQNDMDELNLTKGYLANAYLQIKQFDKAYKIYNEIISADSHAYFAWKQIYAMQVAAGDLKHAKVIKAMLESKGVDLP